MHNQLRKDSASMSKLFYIDYVGCEKRKLDAERIIKYLEANGYNRIADSKKIENADLIVIVTCAFIDEYSAISKKKIENALKQKSESSKIIISGCLPDIEPEYLEEVNIKDCAGPRELAKFDELIDAKISMGLIPEQNVSCFDSVYYDPPNPEFRSDILNEYANAKRFYKIRVSWGCLGKCSYCVTKKAEKNLESKSLDIIKQEYERGYSTGNRNFFITGGDVGAYGIDFGSNFVELLTMFTSYQGFNLYIQEFNAKWLVKYIDDIQGCLSKNIDSYQKIVFNVPIQSGSDTILRKMKRSYRINEVIHAIKRIRDTNHKIIFGTHIIVGFPGETESDFNETLNLIKLGIFDFVMIFKYSDNKHAESHNYKNKVDPLIIQKRFEILREVQKSIDINEGRYQSSTDNLLNNIHFFPDTIDGWLTHKEGQLLYDLAKSVSEGIVIEIGSWQGKSSYYLSKGLKDSSNETLVSVDHHTGSIEQRERTIEPINTLPIFISNMRRAGVASNIKVMTMDSLDAGKLTEDNCASLIFLDGSHDYESVKSDFNCWWPKLKTGGTFVFHDAISKPGVSKFIDNEIINRYDIDSPQIVDDIFYFRKGKRNLDCQNSFLPIIQLKRELSEEYFHKKEDLL